MALPRRHRSLAARDVDHLKGLLRRSIDRLMVLGVSQSQLERTLGLSLGYLSRLRVGRSNPSPVLVALFAVLAAHPKLVMEIAQFWVDNPPPLPQPTPESADRVRSDGDSNDR